MVRPMAPDGITGISIAPVVKWSRTRSTASSGTSGPCDHAALTTAREYLEAQVRQYRPQARLLDYRDRPEMVKPLQAILDQFGPESTSDQGRDIRESMSASFLVFE